MGRMCIIVDCSKTTNDGVSLFGVPSKGARDKWLLFIRKANEKYHAWREQKCMYVCSDHFDLSFIRKGVQGGNTITSSGYPALINGDQLDCDERETSTEPEPSITTFVPQSNFQSIEVETGNELIFAPMTLAVVTPEDSQDHSSKEKDEEIENLKLKLIEKDKELQVVKTRLGICRKRLKSKKRTSIIVKRKLEAAEESVKRIKLEQSVPKHENMPEVLVEFNKRQTMGRTVPFSDALRNFSYTLHYYSARAYNFVRESLPFLPCSSSMFNWTSHVNTRPGFLMASMSFIKRQTSEAEGPLYYALSMDEMHIRKQIIHRGTGFVGYVDYGNLVSTRVQQEEVATTALFIMAAQINGYKKVPVAYALTKGVKASALAEVIKNVLTALANVNARVVSLTFDGLPSNLKAIQALGAVVDVKGEMEMKTFILNPVTQHKVYIMLDPSHMMKLLRNIFKDYGVLLDMDGKEICWRHILQLYKLQEDSGLRAANKLTSRHVYFHNQKMKTKLCLQVLSNSVSVALGVCRELGVEGFKETGATEKFLTYCDKLFDILNSRTNGKGYKAALRKSNIQERVGFFRVCRDYLTGLKRMDGVPLIDTPRGTAIRGLLITMKSVELLYKDLIADDEVQLHYLPLYKISQDLIESYFGLIRSRNGFNNNPNVIQLESAIKATLCMKTQSIATGNCIEQEELSCKVSALSCLQTIMDDDDLEATYLERDLACDVDMNLNELTPFVSNIVVYIAGWVASRLCTKIGCSKCIMLLPIKNEDISKLSKDCILLLNRDLGGLFLPSYEVVEVCKFAEKEIRHLEESGLHKMNKDVITAKVLNHCVNQGVSMECESFRQDPGHSSTLLSEICMEYVTVRFHYMAKRSTLNLNPTTKRSACTKAVLFGGM